MGLIEHLKALCANAGIPITRVILIHETGSQRIMVGTLFGAAQIGISCGVSVEWTCFFEHVVAVVSVAARENLFGLETSNATIPVRRMRYRDIK